MSQHMPDLQDNEEKLLAVQWILHVFRMVGDTSTATQVFQQIAIGKVLQQKTKWI